MRNLVRALAAFAVVCGGVPMLAMPASASCTGEGFDEDIAQGSAIAIVTRTDPGPGNKATFRVERSYGVDLPPTVTSEVSGGMDGRPAVFTGQTAAVVFHREGSWMLLPCGGEEQIGDVLSHFDGRPKVTSAGPAVALAIGYFGGSSLVALDRRGLPVAWDRSERYPSRIAMCPGGRRAVVLASAGETQGAGQQVSVHDIEGLQLRRTVRLGPEAWEDDALALRCADSKGSVLQVLTSRRDGHNYSVALVTVDGGDVSRVSLPVPAAFASHDAQAVPDGFLLLWGEKRELIKISTDGRTSTAIPGRENGFGDFAVADDGRTVAVQASGPTGTEVQVLEVGTGNVVARRPLTEAFHFMRWDGAGRLFVRTGFDQSWSSKPTRGHILVLDRNLKDVANLAGPWSYGAVAVGDRFITFGRTRLGVMNADGTLTESPELRLVAVGDVVAIPGPSTADPLELPTVARQLVIAEGGESTDGPAVAILLGMGLLTLGASVLSLRQIRAVR